MAFNNELRFKKTHFQYILTLVIITIPVICMYDVPPLLHSPPDRSIWRLPVFPADLPNQHFISKLFCLTDTPKRTHKSNGRSRYATRDISRNRSPHFDQLVPFCGVHSGTTRPDSNITFIDPNMVWRNQQTSKQHRAKSKGPWLSFKHYRPDIWPILMALQTSWFFLLSHLFVRRATV